MLMKNKKQLIMKKAHLFPKLSSLLSLVWLSLLLFSRYAVCRPMCVCVCLICHQVGFSDGHLGSCSLSSISISISLSLSLALTYPVLSNSLSPLARRCPLCLVRLGFSDIEPREVLQLRLFTEGMVPQGEKKVEDVSFHSFLSF